MRTTKIGNLYQEAEKIGKAQESAENPKQIEGERWRVTPKPRLHMADAATQPGTG